MHFNERIFFVDLLQEGLDVALRILKRTNDMVNVGMLQGFEVKLFRYEQRIFPFILNITLSWNMICLKDHLFSTDWLPIM